MFARNPRLCRDLNECQSANGGCDQDCINVPGSFYCACADDFDLSPDGKRCMRRPTPMPTTTTTTSTTTPPPVTTTTTTTTTTTPPPPPPVKKLRRMLETCCIEARNLHCFCKKYRQEDHRLPQLLQLLPLEMSSLNRWEYQGTTSA